MMEGMKRRSKLGEEMLWRQLTVCMWKMQEGGDLDSLVIPVGNAC